MKSLRVLAVLVALAVLAILLVKSEVRGEEEDHVADDARRLRELDARLDRAVLEANSGLILNYDELAANAREMASVQADLERSVATLDPELQRRATRSGEQIRRKTALLEKFKSANSVLRNSLAYIPHYARRATTAAAPELDSRNERNEIVTLLAAILRCDIECGPTTLAEVRSAIQAIAARPQVGTPRDRENVRLLLRHAGLVAEMTPEVEETVRMLVETSSVPYDDLYAAARAECQALVARANVYRMGLVGLSLVLLVAVGVAVARLRQTASALEVLNATLESRVEARTSELSASREQFKNLVETTQAIPWEMQPGSLHFGYVGPQVDELLGYASGVWATDAFLERTIHAEDRQGAIAWLEGLATNAPDSDLELRLLAKDGRAVWVRMFARSTEEARGIVRRGFFLDVTMRHQLETDLRAAQKLESVGRLAAGVAHEINTPVQFVADSVHYVRDTFVSLSKLIESLRRLLEASADDVPNLSAAARDAYEAADADYALENVPAALESSVDGLERIASIVRALKEFSHPDRTQKGAIDLNANIRSTLAVAAHEYNQVADVVTELGELPPVVCHGGEINQVLLNLVINAAHAIGDVVASTGVRGNIVVRSALDETDGCVVVTVQDTGGGIPLAVRDRIFDPFFTTKDVGRGSGQGLAIARSIVVEKHGGELAFESTLGVGTIFRLRLPIEPCAQRAAA